MSVQLSQTKEQRSSLIPAPKTRLVRGRYNLPAEYSFNGLLNERSRICELQQRGRMRYLLIAHRRVKVGA